MSKFTRAWQAETRHTLQYLSGRCLDLRNVIDPMYAYNLDLEPARVSKELGRIIEELQRIRDYVESKIELLDG